MATETQATLKQKQVEVAVLERHLAHCPNCGTGATIRARIIRLRREMAEMEQQRQTESARLWTMLGSAPRRQEDTTMAGETLTVGERVVRVTGTTGGWGGNGAGTIVRIIPAHMDKYPVRWVEAKAVVAWPAPRRIGGSGEMHTTVALTSLARPDEVGPCATCGRQRRVYSLGVTKLCGTCIHREQRRINTREMYGHGRRGY